MLLWAANEFLKRFSDNFNVTHSKYSFEIHRLPASESAPQAIAHYVDYVAKTRGECNWQTRVQHLSKDAGEMHHALVCWLKYPLWHLDRSFSQIQPDAPLAGFVMECFNRVGIVRSWRVGIFKPEGEFMKPFYESAWDDFLIQTPDGFLFLHLGVSDAS